MVVWAWQRQIKLTTLLFILALLLIGCERVLQRETDSGPVEVPTVAVPEVPEQIVEETEPEIEEAEPAPAEEETESQSPRPEATATPESATATPEPVASGDEEVTDETAIDTEIDEPETAEGEPAPEDEVVDTPEAEDAVAAVVTPPPPPAPQPGAAPTTHVVAPGENLYRIGLRYGISWATLAQHNNINNPNSIRVGQVLNIPGASVPPISTPALETTYVVARGDNLYRISLRYGISWVQIAEANGIVNPNQVYAGQVLKIPVSAPGPAPQFTHVVARGETIFLISLRYGVSWPAIAQANNLTPPYVIYPGQTLIIPGG